MNEVAKHYDLLIENGNDPVLDSPALSQYMDKWDGQAFIDKMELDKDKTVLEIGIGTGRLAVRVAPLCGELYGVDISSKTIERAKENLADFKNVRLTCADFLSYEFNCTFDISTGVSGNILILRVPVSMNSLGFLSMERTNLPASFSKPAILFTALCLSSMCIKVREE